MASIRRRGRRWYVRRYVGGRQIEEALGTTSARKAQEIQKKFEAKKALGFDPPAKSKTPLAEFLQDFSRHLRLTLRGAKSWKNDTNRLACFFREIKIDRLEALTPALIRHVLDLPGSAAMTLALGGARTPRGVFARRGESHRIPTPRVAACGGGR